MTASTQTPQGAIAHRLLRRKQVEQALGLSRSWIYATLDPKCPQFDPTFPKPIKLGSYTVAWLESEIQGWIESRITASRTAA